MKKLLLAVLYLSQCSLSAQSTAFVYQGRLLENGAPANSTNDFHFRIYSDEAGNNLAGTNAFASDVIVSNGLFTATVDFGTNAFDGSDRWIEVGVRPGTDTGAYTSLTPLQRIGSTPYAIQSLKAGSVTGNIADAQLSANIARLNAPQSFSGNVSFNNASGIFSGNGGGLTNVNAATLNGLAATNFWKTGGNSGTTAGTDFIGTTDHNALEFKVNGQRGLRIQPTTNATVAIVGGSALNQITGNSYGSVIAGGGSTNQPQQILNAALAFIGGGRGNLINSNSGFSSILGGENNIIRTNVFSATIVGGDYNTVGTFSPASVISGGAENSLDQAPHSVIGGGYHNTIDFNTASTISGGRDNAISNSSLYSVIGGGYGNIIDTNSIISTISGGQQNSIQALASAATIAGGYINMVTGSYGTVPGGDDNLAAAYAFAAGHRAKANHTGSFVWADSTDANFVTSANNQFLVRANGGVGININNPQSALHVNGTVTANAFAGSSATLTGPVTVNGNSVWHTGNDGPGSGLDADTVDGLSSAALWKRGGNSETTPGIDYIGTSDNQALELKVNGKRALRIEPALSGDAPNMIGGSVSNYVSNGAYAAVIAGGGSFPYPNSIAANYSAIGGGGVNKIEASAAFATIAGGGANIIRTNSYASVIGGGYYNELSTNSIYSTIAGGLGNLISVDAGESAIVGGSYHQIRTNSDNSFIGGGRENKINSIFGSIAGGNNNEIFTNASYSTIGGGLRNTNTGAYASIPGGDHNVASTSSFAAGHRAKATHTGSFVWADSTDADFSSTTPNQVRLRANGGAEIVSTSQTPLMLDGSNNGGTWLNVANTSTGGRNWSIISTGSGNGEGAGKLLLRDTTQGVVMTLSTNGNVGIGTSSPTDKLVVVNARCDGSSWINASDRNLKQDFAPVDTREVLEKVAALPVESWSYKAQPGEKHIGPVAQDFKAAFGLGSDDTSIATVDEGGVALAAIKGLNEKVEEKEAKIQRLEARLAELERILTRQASTAK
jgi:hypothetical protein